MKATPEKLREHVGRNERVLLWQMPNERLLLQIKDRYTGEIIESFNNHPLHGLDAEAMAQKFDTIVEQLENDAYVRPKRVQYSNQQSYKQTDLFIDDK